MWRWSILWIQLRNLTFTLCIFLLSWADWATAPLLRPVRTGSNCSDPLSLHFQSSLWYMLDQCSTANVLSSQWLTTLCHQQGWVQAELPWGWMMRLGLHLVQIDGIITCYIHLLSVQSGFCYTYWSCKEIWRKAGRTAATEILTPCLNAFHKWPNVCVRVCSTEVGVSLGYLGCLLSYGIILSNIQE